MVMGDLVEDIQMVDEAHHETVLKVGFLNNPDKHPSLRPKYMD